MVIRFIGVSLLLFLIVHLSFVSSSTAQTLVPGIHGTSIVQGVKFTWVIISSDREISVNLRYVGNGTTPPIVISATALTNESQNQMDGPTTLAGSLVLNSGWTTPNSATIKVEGGPSLYNANLVNVIASPYTGPPITTTVEGHGNCDSSYPDICIPSPPPYLNCLDIQKKNFKVLKPDPHGLDNDNDGIGCERP